MLGSARECRYILPMTPEAFIAKWSESTTKERAASQEHFIDLCRVLEEKTPNEADPTGEWYAFEKGVEKTGAGKGLGGRLETSALWVGVQEQKWRANQHDGRRAQAASAIRASARITSTAHRIGYRHHRNSHGIPKRCSRRSLDQAGGNWLIRRN